MAAPSFIEKPKSAQVAVVGAGPAGLNAAYHLGRRGYKVNIFDSLPAAGGMLVAGIPHYRLPRKNIEKDIRYICRHNIDIKQNMTLGKDFTIDDLLKEHKAVFLAIGANLNQKMNIPGEDAEGVIPGIDFLRKANLSGRFSIGSRVAVIGGGNVAIDSARTALRLGAGDVTIVYRRTIDEMPAIKEEVREALDEKIKILYLSSPIAVITEKGKVKGLECRRMELGSFDSGGRRSPVPVKGSEFILDADMIIPAIGYMPDISCLPGSFKSAKGTLAADPVTLTTDMSGVFAGGDAVSGPSSVVEAMASGYRAAVSIDRYMKGQDLHKDRFFQAERRADVPKSEEKTDKDAALEPRASMPSMNAELRICTFEEVNLGFDEDTAVK